MFNPRSSAVRRVSAENPELPTTREAATILRQGGLVAFPTETVYGLGANALDWAAVEKIFLAKGRPATNPVIVHVADVGAARQLTSSWPEAAERLAEVFWPGPLTLVLPKRREVPDIVTAGGRTVGVRVPGHPVALALLREAGVPVAAPSANRSTQISPTRAEHVVAGLEGKVDLILDAGPTSGGLESTVLDLSVDPPRLLRPGLVTVAELEAVVGRIQIPPGMDRETATKRAEPLRSPGLLERHYAPRAKLIRSERDSNLLVARLLESVNRVGWLRFSEADKQAPEVDLQRVRIVEMASDVAEYSRQLYGALHELDDAGVDCIVVDLPPKSDEWLAVHDRLRRAATDESAQCSSAT